MIRGTEIISDEDRFNNFLQMLMRCCVKVMRKLLSKMVSWLGYSDVDRFLSGERAHIQRMAYASMPKSQAILYPGTPTDIKLWDLSLLNCVFTHIQRKIILKEFGNPIDPVLFNNRAQVIATPVGTKNERKLYPSSGQPTDINKWSMTICSCILSVLPPKSQTLLVRIAESFDNIRELRNGLCHPEDPAMTSTDYERYIPVLKTFIDTGLAYLGDDAFEAEIKKEMDDIENGKMKTYLLIDHRHLQQSYHNDMEIIEKLEDIEKAVKELTNKGELNLLVFFGQLPRDQKDLLYTTFFETFTKCLANTMPEAVDDVELYQRIIHACCMTWKYLENPYAKRHVLDVRRKCLEVKIGFDNVLWMWGFIKDYLYGRLESAFEPMQKLLRTQEGCEHLEINLAIPDMFTALMQIGQAVGIGIDSVIFLLEMMFQKSHLRLGESYDALCDSSTQTSQSLLTGKWEYGESGKTVIEKVERVSVDESKTSESSERFFEEYSVDEAGKEVKAIKMKAREKHIEESKSKKEQVSYFCGPCLFDGIKAEYVVKCKDCVEMLCSDCARVHRKLILTRNHSLIEKQSDDLTSLKFTQDTSIQVKSPSDREICNSFNMLILPGNRMLLADSNNDKVKMIDLMTNNLMSQVSVHGKPMGICVLPRDRVAVCLQIKGSTDIQFLEALEQLSLENSITVNGYLRGIGHHNDRLIVSYREGKVEVMDMRGIVMKKLDSGDRKSAAGYSSYLSVVSEGNDAVIYVSDHYVDTITKLDMELNILQSFENPTLRRPRGITAVGNQLLICGLHSNNIMCLDLPSGKLTELLGKKDGILNPENVCYSPHQNRLYVGCLNDTCVRVYKPSNT